MTPEERARQIVADMQIFAERDELARLIADAIREAVRSEREACAYLADRMASQGARVCREVAERIRQREDG